MPRIEDNVVIRCPVQQVWAFISDPRNNARWFAGDVEVKQTSDGPVSVGSTFESVIHLRGPPIVLRVRCMRFESGREISWEFTSGPTRGSEDTWRVEAVNDDTTRLTRLFELKAGGAWRLLRPVIARGARRSHRSEIATVKRILESERQAEA